MLSVYNEIKQTLFGIRTDIAVAPGTVPSDMFTSMAYVVNKNRILLDYTKALQTLYSIEILLNNDAALAEIATVELKTVDQVIADISSFIDKIGYNFGLLRKSAEYATATLTLGRIDAFGSGLSSITIPANQKFKTLNNIEFVANTEYTWQSPTFNPTYNMYTFDISVTCTQFGTIGNVTSGTITVMSPQISNVNFVFNASDITSGIDVETDTDYIARIRLALSGNTFGTPNGYKSLILNNFSTVKDVLVVPVGDPLMTRSNGYGGMIDIYILCEEAPTSTTETFGAYNYMRPVDSQKGVLLPNRPVTSVTNVANAVSYTFQKDTGSLTGSYGEKSYVIFEDVPEPYPPGDITYTYEKIITDIQTFLNGSDYAILGNTISTINSVENIALVKAAVKVEVNISIRIVCLQNYDPTIVIDTVKTNINNYIATLGLSENLAQSDLINVIENSDGVDYVVLPLSQFNKVTETGIASDITVEKNEYIRIATSGLSVTL